MRLKAMEESAQKKTRLLKKEQANCTRIKEKEVHAEVLKRCNREGVKKKRERAGAAQVRPSILSNLSAISNLASNKTASLKRKLSFSNQKKNS
jgi:hypothetical protein